nr:MAG TPA: hypothetical protein [Caudoviricetes sp.]
MDIFVQHFPFFFSPFLNSKFLYLIKCLFRKLY